MEFHELWLLRHAKAQAGGLVEDIDRALNDRGKQDAVQVGEWMKQQGLIPDYIISSPAKRARQTATRVCSQLGIDPDTVHYDVQLYLAPQRILLEVISATGSACHKLLLIGHNPGLEDLLLYLCPEPLPRTPTNDLLNTANLARIRLPDAWKWLQQGVGELLDLVRPAQIG